MPRLLTAALMAGLTVALIPGFAQQPATKTTPKIKVVAIQPTSPASGVQMYTTYCAVCHGADGLGHGPAAAALKTPPTNLTELSKANGGTFPSDHVYSVLKFGTKAPAHGTADMPIWGDLMQSLGQGGQANDSVVHERIANLTTYLKQMQK